MTTTSHEERVAIRECARKARAKQYRDSDAAKTKKRDYDRRRYARRKEENRIQSKEYYIQNKEVIKARVKKWREANPDRVVDQRHKRVRRVDNATPKWLTDAQRQEIRSTYILAKQQGLTVDHIVPLKGKMVCGLHVPWNLQLMTREENDAKGNKHYV